jgi:hypothetical protein
MHWLAGVVALVVCPMAAIADEDARPEPTWSPQQREHWSLRPRTRPAVPAIDPGNQAQNPVDSFVLLGMQPFDLPPAREADRPTLLRRLTFDLTGLPPTPEEIEAFASDNRPDAYERVVERLLSSPAYGERWARHWLDLARFAESDGFKSDKTRPNAWRYRDWVVASLNADLSYDEFVRLQLAGDEIAPHDAGAFIATGFNRHWPFEDNNKVPGLNRQLMLDDMTDTTASVFLGLTVACARCHDHKYDPISQRDYYRFEALFASAEPKDDRPLADPFAAAEHEFVAAAHGGRLAALRREVESIERPYAASLLKDRLDRLPAEVRKAFETEPEKRSAFQEDLLVKHAQAMAVAPKAMREAMPPDVRSRWESRQRDLQAVAKQGPVDLPTASGMAATGTDLPPVRLLRKGNFGQPTDIIPAGFPSVLAPDRSADPGRLLGRRDLAEWLTRPDHPLTARVIANRLWQHHFGRGIVATPSDFGTQGAEPSHAGLLDWLAGELVASGWSMKALHRLMVTSATYRQASTPSARALADDPDNLLFSRMLRRRLEGEAVRDALLAISGRLDRRIGGPSVFPELPPGVQTRGGWTRSETAADRDRRSLYVFVRRNLKYPLFDAFDAPDSNVTCPERNVSVNAPQALMLLNSDLVIDLAKSFATLLEAEAPGSNEGRVRRAYLLALGRAPTRGELDRCLTFLREAGLPDFCHALFNLNEFVFID